MYLKKHICVWLWFMSLCLSVFSGINAVGDNVFELKPDKDLKLK